MFLVYEVNDLPSGECDTVEEIDMKLFSAQEEALEEFKRRKDMYLDSGNYTYQSTDSNEMLATFLCKDVCCGSFEIRIVELHLGDNDAVKKELIGQMIDTVEDFLDEKELRGTEEVYIQGKWYDMLSKKFAALLNNWGVY